MRLLEELGVDEFKILLDKTELSKKLVTKLKSNPEFIFSSFEIIESDGTDPEEYLRRFNELSH